MGCCGGADTSEGAIEARKKAKGKGTGEGAELEDDLNGGGLTGKNMNGGEDEFEDHKYDNLKEGDVIKIGAVEFHKTDPNKNFLSLCYDIKGDTADQQSTTTGKATSNSNTGKGSKSGKGKSGKDNINDSNLAVGFLVKGIPIMNYNHEAQYINLKEIKDFCSMFLNEKRIPFNFEYNFPKEGKYNFRFKYKFALNNTSNMFFGCKTLISLDLSSFDTKHVKNMSCMFFGCTNLENLNISKFNTSQVTYMSNMFAYCSYLKTLDLSSFNTENVTNMGNMFQDCKSLTSLNISNFTTPKVTFLEGIFEGVNKKCQIICKDQKILAEFK